MQFVNLFISRISQWKATFTDDLPLFKLNPMIYLAMDTDVEDLEIVVDLEKIGTSPFYYKL